MPCECWTVVNEDTVSINYTVTNCDGTEQSPNLLPGARRNHCIKGGSIIYVNSPEGGLLGEYDCGVICTQGGGQCSDCGPTTTTTTTTSTTTTTTTAASTTTSTTTTTTTTIGYDFYYADDYSCADPCGLFAADQIVAFPAGSSVTNNKFYSWSGGTDSFKITGTTTDPSYPVPLLYPVDGPLDSCTLACSVS